MEWQGVARSGIGVEWSVLIAKLLQIVLAKLAQVYFPHSNTHTHTHRRHRHVLSVGKVEVIFSRLSTF